MSDRLLKAEDPIKFESASVAMLTMHNVVGKQTRYLVICPDGNQQLLIAELATDFAPVEDHAARNKDFCGLLIGAVDLVKSGGLQQDVRDTFKEHATKDLTEVKRQLQAILGSTDGSFTPYDQNEAADFLVQVEDMLVIADFDSFKTQYRAFGPSYDKFCAELGKRRQERAKQRAFETSLAQINAEPDVTENDRQLLHALFEVPYTAPAHTEPGIENPINPLNTCSEVHVTADHMQGGYLAPGDVISFGSEFAQGDYERPNKGGVDGIEG